ncbi:lysosome-associated membrane glycoprotein 3 isoform X2 [Polyodon spathula]|uniref:lysosome-associated membrane glycoprotein 3 isoform X2 n=1 Tax=Polyodon spathula TaxID=7913 RepID=UPI001B7EEC77|nr:lysosome-associated membrane glycoprotein 3 isoform X2 [Polyodon spathula]
MSGPKCYLHPFMFSNFLINGIQILIDSTMMDQLLIFLLLEMSVYTASPLSSPNNHTTPVPGYTTTVANHSTESQAVHTTTQSANQTTASGTHHKTASSNRTKPTLIPVGPTLSPKSSTPTTGNYTITNNNTGTVCIQALMGIQFTVTRNQGKSYFNINPNSTEAKGLCGENRSWFNLNFSGGFVNFTFVKNEGIYYVDEIEVTLLSSAIGKETQMSKDYHGHLIDRKLFKAAVGRSFKCTNQQEVSLKCDFNLYIVNTQFQAFNITNGQFGKVQECLADMNERKIPIVLGVSVAGLCLIILVTCLLAWQQAPGGYERI